MTKPGHCERGAALIVGLVLLMVLTVLAISAMRSATLNLTMASNAQYRENAFQLAESGIQATMKRAQSGALNLDDPVEVPDCPPPPVAPQQIWDDATLLWKDPVVVAALQGNYRVRICREKEETVDLYGTSVGKQLHYRIESRGRTNQRNAEAIHAQGFFRQVNE